jgi:inorganic pyrophosphatase
LTDEAGADDKIIAVPIDKLNPCYGLVQSPGDLPQARKIKLPSLRQFSDTEGVRIRNAGRPTARSKPAASRAKAKPVSAPKAAGLKKAGTAKK